MPWIKPKKKLYTPIVSWRRRWLLPGGFFLVSFLFMILPLEGVISSVKAVLSYIFIPQIRAAHSAVQYGQGVSNTVQELLRAHQENQHLKQEIETAQLRAAQAAEVFEENQRLARLLKLQFSKPWEGIWAKVAYREPTRWNTVILDKGTADGIQERSAVISMENGKEGLAGIVVETTERTSKVLLVRDEEFSAAVRLENGEEGLLVGNGPRSVQIKYIPLLAQIKKGDKVYTSASSSVFPAGILVGEVNAILNEESFQTALTVSVNPAVRASAVKEVFVISATGTKR